MVKTPLIVLFLVTLFCGIASAQDHIPHPGIGLCQAGSFVTGLVPNAPPRCAAGPSGSFAAGLDLGGSSTAQTVIGLHFGATQLTLSGTAPTSGQFLENSSGTIVGVNGIANPLTTNLAAGGNNITGVGQASFQQGSNNLAYADQYAGATLDVKIAAAMAVACPQTSFNSVPVTNGVVDARGLKGNQSWASSLQLNPNCVFLLPQANITLGAGAQILFDSGDTIKGAGSLGFVQQRGTLIIQNSADTQPMLAYYDGTSGNGAYGPIIEDMSLRAANAAGTALSLVHTQQAQINNIYTSGNVGVTMGFTGGCDCYNSFHEDTITGISYGLYILPGTYANENQFYGGRFLSTGGPSIYAGGDVNTFYSPDLEVSSIGVEFPGGGGASAVYSPYDEGDTTVYQFDSGAVGNMVWGGGSASPIVDNSGNQSNLVFTNGASANAGGQSPVLWAANTMRWGGNLLNGSLGGIDAVLGSVPDGGLSFNFSAATNPVYGRIGRGPMQVGTFTANQVSSNGIGVTALPNPSAPTCVYTGAAGSTTYTFYNDCTTTTGGKSLLSAACTVTSAQATLDASDFVNVTAACGGGYNGTHLLENGTSGANVLVTSTQLAPNTVAFKVSGQALGSYTPSARNTTADFALAGGATIGSPTGGNEGTGTLNATNLYVNGSAIGASAAAHSGISLTAGAISQSQPVYYVQDYGAVCDDSTNDATAINAAFTAAAGASTSAEVDFPNGKICKVSTGISVNGGLVGINGNGSALDCSTFASGTCLTLTGASTGPALYKQNKIVIQALELIGPGSGTAGVLGLKFASTANTLIGVNVHDFATNVDLSGNNTFVLNFYNLQSWNAVTAISTGSGAPTQSGENINFWGGDIFNSTNGVSMLNTSGGYNLNFHGTSFDGMTGSMMVLATGGSETAQVRCYGCHFEYTAGALPAIDMIQIGGTNQYTSYTDFGSSYQTDTGTNPSIDSVINASGSGRVHLYSPFLSIAGYTAGVVKGSGAGNVVVEDAYTGSTVGVTNGVDQLPATNLGGGLMACTLSAGDTYGVLSDTAACPSDFTSQPEVLLDSAGNIYDLATTGHNINLFINNSAGMVVSSTAVTGTAGETFNIKGSSSGNITIAPQAASGTYNFNLPITAGSSGQALLSGGGSGAPMTWGSAGSAPATHQVTTSGNAQAITASCDSGQTVTEWDVILTSSFTAPTITIGGSCAQAQQIIVDTIQDSTGGITPILAAASTYSFNWQAFGGSQPPATTTNNARDWYFFTNSTYATGKNLVLTGWLPNTIPNYATAGTCSANQYATATSSSGVTCAQVANTQVTGLGTSSTVNTGTSGATLGLLNSNLTFGGTDTFSSAPTMSGANVSATTLPVGSINATGTPSSSTFLRGDGAWAAPSAGSVERYWSSSTSGTAAAIVLTNFWGVWKATDNYTIDNMTVTTTGFTCSVNPTVTFEDCGTSTTCASPTALWVATLAGTNTFTPGTSSSNTMPSGDYFTFKFTGGTCTALDGQFSVAFH